MEQLAGHMSPSWQTGCYRIHIFRVPHSYSGWSLFLSLLNLPPNPFTTLLPPEVLHSPWSSWQSDCAASGGLEHAGSWLQSPYGSGGITPCCGLSSRTSTGDKIIQINQKGHGAKSAILSELPEEIKLSCWLPVRTSHPLQNRVVHSLVT